MVTRVGHWLFCFLLGTFITLHINTESRSFKCDLHHALHCSTPQPEATHVCMARQPMCPWPFPLVSLLEETLGAGYATEQRSHSSQSGTPRNKMSYSITLEDNFRMSMPSDLECFLKTGTYKHNNPNCSLFWQEGIWVEILIFVELTDIHYYASNHTSYMSTVFAFIKCN